MTLGTLAWRKTLALLLTGVALLCALVAPAADPPPAEEPLEDPVPIRRVLLPADRVAAEMERVKRGVLVQLPRDEFDAKVAQAAQAAAPLKHPPQLVEARYRAALNDTALVGTAEWKIVNPSAQPGLLPLQPLALALRQARWPDNKDAVLGDLDADRELDLLVEGSGERSLFLEWSARSNPVSGGLRFSLDVPACAVATLDLDLPADSEVTASPDSYLVSGPYPGAGDRRAWKIGFAGRSQVNFVVRRFKGPNLPAPLVLSRLQTRQDLAPGKLTAEFDFDLEVLHGAVKELRAECALGLRPTEVAIRGLEGWELRPAGNPNAPGTLIIRLREPFQGGTLVVRCLGQLATDKPWVSPSLRLLNVVPRGESLVLRLSPELQMEDWRPAGFRLTRTTFEQDRTHVLTLGAGLDAGPTPDRPSAKLQVAGTEFVTRQQTSWYIAPEGSTAVVDLACEVTRGRLFRVPIQVPTGWEVEAVEPADVVRFTTPVPDKGRTILIVDLHKPLEPGPATVLTLRARQTTFKGVPAGGLTLPIPGIAPLETRYHAADLSIYLAPLYTGTISASVPAVTPDQPDADAVSSRPIPPARNTTPWGKQAADYLFRFRGQPAEGTINLRNRPAQLRARAATDVFLASGHALAWVRLELHPEVGSPTQVDLFTPGQFLGRWDWKVVRGRNSVRRVDRLTAYDWAPAVGTLAARSPLQLACLAALPPTAGDWWRLTFTQPVTEPLTLEAAVELPGQGAVGTDLVALLSLGSRQPLATVCTAFGAVRLGDEDRGERRWDVPLVTVPRAYRLDGRVTLHLTGADLVHVEARGLQEISEAGRGDAAATPRPALGRPSSWRTFRYGPPPMTLTLRGQPPAGDRAAEAVVDRAWLTTTLEADGLRHHYRFHIWNWGQPTVQVQLPPGAQLVAASADNRWLHRLALENGAVTLPVTSESVLHRFELVYRTPLPGWSVWSRLEAPAPELPVRCLAFRRIWRLPDGVTPSAPGNYQRLPGGPVDDDLFAELTRLPPAPSAADVARQQQGMAEAAARFQKLVPAGAAGRLGVWLDLLAADCLRDLPPLVIDSDALREAGIAATARLQQSDDAPLATAPFWEQSGLVYVPCRAAPLLTTRQRLAAWQALDAGAGTPQVSIEDAVAEAARFGHDDSGRFRTVNDWLRGNDAEPVALPIQLPSSLARRDGEADSASWEPLAGAGYDSSLTVVRDEAASVAGLTLAVVLGLTAGLFGGRLPPRWARRLLLGGLGGAGLALLWLPVALRGLALWPALAGILIGVAWALRRTPTTSRPDHSDVSHASTVTTTLPVTGVLLALAVLMGSPGQAAAPTPAVIYLVNGDNGAKPVVLVAPELLEQLQLLSRRGAAGLSSAVFLGVTYEGSADHQSAQIEARFPVYCFADEATLTLPLANVQLVEALLDGAAAHPVALRAPREGYTIDVKGQGSHTVVVRFTAPLPGGSDDRELRFGVPELSRSRLKLTVPAGAGYLQAVEARGSQRVVSDDKATVLEADLGAVPAVRVRWRRDGQQPRPATVSVKEAYFWDLNASAARLLGVLEYTVTKGWQTTFELELPKELDVVSAEAGPVVGGVAPPRLREWSVRTDNGPRRLQLEFQGPVSGTAQVTLELAPRQPFGKNATLLFPTPLEAFTHRAFLAYRADGLVATYADSRGITGIKPEQVPSTFAQEFGQAWKAARQEDIPVPKANGFWRDKGGTLLLDLKPPQPQSRARQDVTWRVETRQASLRASASLSVPDASLSLVEWDVPAAVQVNDVTGPLVRSWSRAGGRVQVWLQRPASDVTLTLTGWLPRPANAPRFDLPYLRVEARTLTSTIKVQAGDSVTLAPGTFQGLTPLTDQNVTGREWVYAADQAAYSGFFTTSPAATNADFRLLTFAEVRNRQLTFVSTLDCQVKQGELRQLTVTLRNWEGSEVQLQAADVARRREQRLGGAGRSWILDLQPGINRRYQLTLTGSVPLGSNPEVYMPDLRVDTPGTGPVRLERWLAVSGPELVAEGAAGVVPLPHGTDELLAWPRDAERLRRAGGLVWRVTADDWRLRLRSRLETARPTPVQVFLTEHAAAVADGRRWTHKATYWLYHEAGADLSLTMPAGATVLSVTIDGQSVPPLQPGADRLWLPLAGGAGARVVRLSWAFLHNEEPIESPFLAGPRLEGVPGGPVVWTVHVPAGYQLRRGAADAENAGGVGLDLARAAAQLRILTRLIERARDENEPAPAAQVSLARQRFDQLCRQVEYQMALPGADPQGKGPDGQSLAAWLQELRDQFRALAAANPAELARVQPDPKAAAAAPETSVLAPFPFALAPFERGRPVYWQAAGNDAPPRVRLQAVEALRSREALGLSTVFLVLLLAVWILAHFFKASAWPEQLALFGLMAAVLLPPPAGRLFLVLVTAGVVARLVLLGRWAVARWQQRHQPPPMATPV